MGGPWTSPPAGCMYAALKAAEPAISASGFPLTITPINDVLAGTLIPLCVLLDFPNPWSLPARLGS